MLSAFQSTIPAQLNVSQTMSPSENFLKDDPRRAKLQSSRHHKQTNNQLFYRPDALPVTQPTVSGISIAVVH